MSPPESPPEPLPNHTSDEHLGAAMEKKPEIVLPPELDDLAQKTLKQTNYVADIVKPRAEEIETTEATHPQKTAMLASLQARVNTNRAVRKFTGDLQLEQTESGDTETSMTV